MRIHHPWRPFAWLHQSIIALAILLLAMTAQAIDTEFYVAVDKAEVMTFGNYEGLPNPNYGRLTFLFAHPNEEDPSVSHFHGIGAYDYTGPVDNPTVISTNTNNRLPETYTGALPLRLLPGAGTYEGKLISQDTGEEYSHLKIASVQALSGFASDSLEDILFHSSNDRWSTPLDGAVVALQMVSITPTLHMADDAGNPVFASHRRHPLGDGNSLAFFPTFWTEADAPAGTYSATFKLVDMRTEGEPLKDSGRFTLDFRVPQSGDLDGDNDVDWDDVILLIEALNTPATGPYDPHDLNHDGAIDFEDLRLVFDLVFEPHS